MRPTNIKYTLNYSKHSDMTFSLFLFQLHPNVTQGNGHAVLTSSTTQIAFQVIIVVIRQLIVMTSQMNKIAVSITLPCKIKVLPSKLNFRRTF